MPIEEWISRKYEIKVKRKGRKIVEGMLNKEGQLRKELSFWRLLIDVRLNVLFPSRLIVIYIYCADCSHAVIYYRLWIIKWFTHTKRTSLVLRHLFIFLFIFFAFGNLFFSFLIRLLNILIFKYFYSKQKIRKKKEAHFKQVLDSVLILSCVFTIWSFQIDVIQGV